MPSNETNKDRIAKAAEALVQAASMEVDSVTQEKLTTNLESLKTTFDSKLNTITQSMKSSNENFDSKINTVNQHLTKLQQEMTVVKGLLEVQNKREKLKVALGLTHLGSFEYSDGSTKKSSDLVKTILGWFILGFGFNIAKTHRMSGYCYDSEKPKKEEEFRTKLSKQLRDLIGHDPRIVKNGADFYTVSYK